jgi:ATP-dependent Clp protease ATP-binding subunit ClpC
VLQDLKNRLSGMEFSLSLNKEAKKFVADKGFDPQFGARPLHRAIQKYIEDPLAEFLLSENPKPGSELTASLNKEKDGLKIALKKQVKSDSDVEQ